MIINPNAQQIIESRYLWIEKNEKTWGDVARRVGSVVGSATTDTNLYIDKFINMIDEGYFIPGGRINRNAGRPRGSMFNCYCVPFGDSIEEIANGTAACMQLWKDGGGCGVPLSGLRPSGTPLVSSGGYSSGPLPFLYGLNEIGKAIETGGQRRAAGLALLSISHPDVLKFIDSKKSDGKLSHFNISVGITEDFIDSVRQDREWPLIWQNKIYNTVSARELWAQIVKGLSQNGEPGLINLDNLTINNSYYFSPIIGCNPCGEAVLEAWGVCNLGSLVLKNFVSNGRVKWKQLEEIIHLAVRFLDHAIDVNVYALPQIKQTAQKSRRIGIGVMGLADMFFDLGIRYGSPAALDFTERLFKFIRNISYEASVKLATERGTFPAFDSTLYCKAKFIKTLPPSLRTDIRKYGTRNVTVMAMAPTGTISLVPECTSGIEPLMYKAYRRNDRVSTRYYIHPMYNPNEPKDYLVDSTDLGPLDHIEMQSTVQKYTDGAVSKTILIPKDYSDDYLSDIILESISDLKGITVYRDGSREGQPVVPLTQQEVEELLKTQTKTLDVAIEVLDCAKGGCEI